MPTTSATCQASVVSCSTCTVAPTPITDIVTGISQRISVDSGWSAWSWPADGASRRVGTGSSTRSRNRPFASASAVAVPPRAATSAGSLVSRLPGSSAASSAATPSLTISRTTLSSSCRTSISQCSTSL